MWVAFVIGLAMGPSLDGLGVLFILAIIVASGAAIGMQVSAGIAFIVGVLAVEEIILVSNLVTPAKTQPALRRLHDWALAHRRKLLVATFAVAGISLIAAGHGQRLSWWWAESGATVALRRRVISIPRDRVGLNYSELGQQRSMKSRLSAVLERAFDAAGDRHPVRAGPV